MKTLTITFTSARFAKVYGDYECIEEAKKLLERIRMTRDDQVDVNVQVFTRSSLFIDAIRAELTTTLVRLDKVYVVVNAGKFEDVKIALEPTSGRYICYTNEEFLARDYIYDALMSTLDRLL